MSTYDSTTVFEANLKSISKVPERPMLHLATPAATPPHAHDRGFDRNQWDGSHSWQNHLKPDSPQSLTSLDHSSPTSEDLSHLPKCRKCGLTTNQHAFVQAYICGHLCRDIPQDNFCPDIDAPLLSSKDCPIHSPKKRDLARRRSSLLKPPMLARDESTYEDVNEEKIVAVAPAQVHGVEKKDRLEDTKSIKDSQSKPSKEPVYRVSRNSRGNADWRKHCRVEKAMQQMLFGDARVSAHIMLEHTQKVGASERNLVRGDEGASLAQDSSSDDDDDDGLRSAMGATKLEAEKHTNECAGLESPKAAQAALAEHNLDCAICSDEEEEDEAEDEFQDAMSATMSATKVHGCALDDGCSSCAEDLVSNVESGDFVLGETPHRRMDRSRAY